MNTKFVLIYLAIGVAIYFLIKYAYDKGKADASAATTVTPPTTAAGRQIGHYCCPAGYSLSTTANGYTCKDGFGHIAGVSVCSGAAPTL